MASRRRERRVLAKSHCGHKIRHATYEEALLHAQTLKLNPYRCIICGAWHVGHGTQPTTEFFGA